MRIIRALFGIVGMMAGWSGSYPLHATGQAEPEEFKAGEMIMHHIADAHEIHIIGNIAVYLPVIVKAEDGWHVFSSAHFYHNPQQVVTPSGEKITYYEHDGLVLFHEKIYVKGSGVQVDERGHIINAKVSLDMSITKNIFGVFLASVLLVIIFWNVSRAYQKRTDKAPAGMQSLLEPIILFIRDEVAIPSIGKEKADRFMPFLLTVFFFIWLSNLIGLIPFIGGFNITGSLAVTLVLATLVFIITSVNGNRHYWTHILWPSGVPLPIKFILVPIEFAGVFIRPAVLMIRLTANITAGHIIILAFVSLIFIFGSQNPLAGYGVGAGAVIFMVFMYFIELLVAFLQAYVFTLLSAIYFGTAVEEAHH